MPFSAPSAILRGVNNDRSSQDFDIAVVGGGSAGFAAARAAASAGLRTALIEGAAEVGGLCILRGCMPTKRLLYAAEVLHHARQASQWGLRVPEAKFDFAQVMARKDALIKEFAADRRRGLSEGGFQFIPARARFLDAHTLELRSGARLTAGAFIIATGSTAAPCPVPSLEKLGYLTSDGALTLARLPESLVVLGGGPLGTEFAQFFARFDVKVTLVQRDEHLLNHFDADAGAVLEEVFRQEGLEVFTAARLLEAQRQGNLKEVLFEHRGRQTRIAAEEILFALGRVPNLAALGLESAGIKTEAGRILTDRYLETSVPHIYAAGDCVGSREVVHRAIQQAEVAVHNIAHPHQRRAMNDRLFVQVVFTEPQVASVGLTEQAAQHSGIPYLAASAPFTNSGKAIVMEATAGFVKLLAEPSRGEILGACCVGPLGGELIHEIVAAMQGRLTVRELADLPHYHPTLASLWTYPAVELARQIKDGMA